MMMRYEAVCNNTPKVSERMRRIIMMAFATLCLATMSIADEAIETFDDLRLSLPKEKGSAQLVEGKFRKAVELSFEEKSQNSFFATKIRGNDSWDQAAGFSFWLRGDGSKNFGGLQFIYDEDYSVRYDYIFPLANNEWHQVVVAWSDLIPVLPGGNNRSLDAQSGNKPSKISALWFGKWWYHRDYPACKFAVDDFRLIDKIETDSRDYKPSANPLDRTLAKLKAGEPITIVTMGDSLTDTRHWANREVNWPSLLKKELESKYKSKVTIVNPAIGGTQLRQNIVLMPRWLAETPEPDLVTICFGFNDWDAGMRGEEFRRSYIDAVNRIRRATGGKSDVMILTTSPAATRWSEMVELSQACRDAAKDRNAGLADLEKAMHAAGERDRERLYVDDKVHLGPAGHEVVKEEVLRAIGGN